MRQILVIAAFKKCLGCDFDLPIEFASENKTVRLIMEHGDGFRDGSKSPAKFGGETEFALAVGIRAMQLQNAFLKFSQYNGL